MSSEKLGEIFSADNNRLVGTKLDFRAHFSPNSHGLISISELFVHSSQLLVQKFTNLFDVLG